ncbi:MAG: Bro-N domain-containing protein, partial [Candidatus Fonsibacter sp.]
KILGYAHPRFAIRDHIPEKYKNTLENLMTASGRGETSLPNYNDRIAMFINEPGLYRLIFRSKVKEAEAFTDWVCSEVLPSIRKNGSYITKELAMQKWNLYEYDQEDAIRRINNPVGETALHYT